jgi:hypothetical protein
MDSDLWFPVPGARAGKKLLGAVEKVGAAQAKHNHFHSAIKVATSPQPPCENMGRLVLKERPPNFSPLYVFECQLIQAGDVSWGGGGV